MLGGILLSAGLLLAFLSENGGVITPAAGNDVFLVTEKHPKTAKKLGELAKPYETER